METTSVTLLISALGERQFQATADLTRSQNLKTSAWELGWPWSRGVLSEKQNERSGSWKQLNERVNTSSYTGRLRVKSYNYTSY